VKSPSRAVSNSGFNMTNDMNENASALPHETPANRPVQALLSTLWVANIVFFLYFLVKHS